MGGLATTFDPLWKMNNKLDPLGHYLGAYGKGAPDTFDPIATKMGAQGYELVQGKLPDGVMSSNGPNREQALKDAADQTAINRQRASSALRPASSSATTSTSKLLLGQ